MQEIVFKLKDDSGKVKFYCVIDSNRLFVVPSKSLEKKVFWNELKDYEIKNGKILRVNNYKDNVLSRLLGTSEKSQRSFDIDSDIGVSDLSYFSLGVVCVSIQKVYQDGLDYTCDFVACCTDTINLFNFYSVIKENALIWGTSPYHLRGRCNVNDLRSNIFLSVDYVLGKDDYYYIQDKEIYDKYLESLSTWCKWHNENIFLSHFDNSKST